MVASRRLLMGRPPRTAASEPAARDVLVVLGLAIMTAGIAMWCIPLSLIILGASLLSAGIASHAAQPPTDPHIHHLPLARSDHTYGDSRPPLSAPPEAALDISDAALDPGERFARLWATGPGDHGH